MALGLLLRLFVLLVAVVTQELLNLLVKVPGLQLCLQLDHFSIADA